MPFNLFRKKKQPEETPAMPPQEEPKQEAPAPPPEQPPVHEPMPEPTAQPILPETSPAQEPASENVAPAQEQQPQEPAVPAAEQKPEATEPSSKTYLKAMPLRELSDVEKVKQDVLNGNIIILRVTPLASKSIEDVKNAVNELFQFAESVGGDIARLGEERVVICPKTVRIWREKTPAPVSSSEPLPTAA